MGAFLRAKNFGFCRLALRPLDFEILTAIFKIQRRNTMKKLFSKITKNFFEWAIRLPIRLINCSQQAGREERT